MRDKRRRHAGHQLFSLCQKGANSLNVATHVFGILRTYLGAFTAIDTFPLDDLGLVILDFDGLNRTIPYALIAIFAVGFFEL